MSPVAALVQVSVVFALVMAVTRDVGAAEPSAASRPAAGASVAANDSARTVYMQRDTDGKMVFTDRPAAGLITERRWAFEPEDAEAAAARREASRAQSEQVTERIQRSIDQQQQRVNDLQIEQLRAQRAADTLRAERLRERERAEESRVVLLPPYAHPFGLMPFGQMGPYRPDGQPSWPKPPAKPPAPTGPLAPPVVSR